MSIAAAETWESIWALLLMEAAQRACTQENGAQKFAQLVSAIVLAKASWEAFQNEFVESRSLPQDIKAKSLTNAIQLICNALGTKEFNFQRGTVWEALLCVSRLRNAIVHHAAKPHKAGEAPSGLITMLEKHGLIDFSDSNISWESLLVTPKTSVWCCITVGKAILELERIPNRRRRSPGLVEQKVMEALDVIPESLFRELNNV
jgi:hypothetical protein